VPRRGDVVLAHFPFTSQGGTKLRPVLILAEVPGPYPDFIVMFISSQVGQAVPGFDLVLGPTDRHLLAPASRWHPCSGLAR
jgi:hypothetical protein